MEPTPLSYAARLKMLRGERAEATSPSALFCLVGPAPIAAPIAPPALAAPSAQRAA